VFVHAAAREKQGGDHPGYESVSHLQLQYSAIVCSDRIHAVLPPFVVTAFMRSCLDPTR